MRHMHASLILNLAPEGEAHRYLKIVSQRLGHCNVQFTLDVYGHVLPELEQDSAERLRGYSLKLSVAAEAEFFR